MKIWNGEQRGKHKTLKASLNNRLATILSGVPQGTVLGPVLFNLFINDITQNIQSNVRLFADDCVCYRSITTTEDCIKLQQDISQCENVDLIKLKRCIMVA